MFYILIPTIKQNIKVCFHQQKTPNVPNIYISTRILAVIFIILNHYSYIILSQDISDTVTMSVFVPLYLVTTVEFRHCGSWKVTVRLVLPLTLRRTIDGASGAPEQGHRGALTITS